MRATFANPNFICSFNSLTQCLFNVRILRKAILDYDTTRDGPPAMVDGENQPPRVARIIEHNEKSVIFAKEYQEIMRRMSDRGRCLNLSLCVENLEDPYGQSLLKDGPTDPLLEFIAIIRIFSAASTPFMFAQLTPLNSVFTDMFSFMMSRGFVSPTKCMFLSASVKSSIFEMGVAGCYYDFRRDDNPSGLTVLHSLPDVICMRFETEGSEHDGCVQMTIDFNGFVFDNSKNMLYNINSMVMMINDVHAIAYVKLPEGDEWLICNDREQTVIGPDALRLDLLSCGPSKRVILAFYDRVDST